MYDVTRVVECLAASGLIAHTLACRAAPFGGLVKAVHIQEGRSYGNQKSSRRVVRLRLLCVQRFDGPCRRLIASLVRHIVTISAAEHRSFV